MIKKLLAGVSSIALLVATPTFGQGSAVQQQGAVTAGTVASWVRNGVVTSKAVSGSGSVCLTVACSLTNPTISGAAPTGAGTLGYAAGVLQWGDSTVTHNAVSTDQTQTVTNKTITSSSGQFVTQLSMAGGSAVGGPAVLIYQAPGGGCPWLVLGPAGTFISTTGTTTCGLQEAINYASANAYALHVMGRGYAQPGGSLPQNLIATSTITIPRSLQSAVTFDNVVLTVIPSDQGDGMVVDTAELMQFDFRSLLLYQGNGYALRFKPSTANAPDGVIYDLLSKFYFGSVVVQPNTGLTPLGAVAFDLTSGTIDRNLFQFGEICGSCYTGPTEGVTGISVINPQAGTYFRDNRIEVETIYGFSTYGVREGTATTNQANLYNNRWYVNSIDLQNTALIGFDTFGSNDTADIGITPLYGAPTNALVFESGAAQNSYILRKSAASGTPVVDTSGGNNWVDMTNTNQKIGARITQSTNYGGEFTLLQSVTGSSENAVRLDTTKTTSGIALKLSNSGNNNQAAIRLNALGGLDFYTGQTAGQTSTGGTRGLELTTTTTHVYNNLAVDQAIQQTGSYLISTAANASSGGWQASAMNIHSGGMFGSGADNTHYGICSVGIVHANGSSPLTDFACDASGNTTIGANSSTTTTVQDPTIKLPNIPVTPTGKQPLCIDTTTRQLYYGSGGSC